MLPILIGLVEDNVKIVRNQSIKFKRFEMYKLAFFVKSSSVFGLPTSVFWKSISPFNGIIKT
jgi:hypothetical protein